MELKNVVKGVKNFHKRVCCDHETDHRIVFHYSNMYFLSALMGIIIASTMYVSDFKWYNQWYFWGFIIISYVSMFYSREQRQNYIKLKLKKKRSDWYV